MKKEKAAIVLNELNIRKVETQSLLKATFLKASANPLKKTARFFLMFFLLSLLLLAANNWLWAQPLINEFVFNHTGTDNSEFVEIFGDPNTDYSAY